MTVPDFPPGRVLAGKYALVASLARTPWAATYRATAGPGREVVVKVLDVALADQPALMDAIVRAGTAASAVPQPPALPVLEHGKDPESGALFIVTRPSTYPSLATHLERGPLPPEVVLALVRGLAQVLDALHAAGRAHLAIKPTNVFLGTAPPYPIEINDFGANAVRALVPDEVRQSFSAAWLAPEQLANDSMASPSTDVFATALVAFAALTGKSFWRSFSAPTPDLNGWRAEVIAPPARASQRAAEMGQSLSPAFDSVFARALSVPRDRFATTGELARALAAAFDASRAGASNRPPAPPPAPGEALPYAATVPRPDVAAPPFGAGVAPAGAPGSPVQATAAPSPSPSPSVGPPSSVAGVPKKGGKALLFAVVGVAVLLVAGTALYFVQRARAANAVASAYAAAASASASAAAASASASAAAAAASASAALAAEAPAAGSAAPPASPSTEAPATGPSSVDAGAVVAAAAGSAAAPTADPAPPPPAQDTAAPAVTAKPPASDRPTTDRPASGSSGHSAPAGQGGGPGPGGPAPAAGTASATTTGATGTGHKKPCGKFLERCPDSGS